MRTDLFSRRRFVQAAAAVTARGILRGAEPSEKVTFAIFNRDHKWTFTVNKARSWSDRSINVLELLADLGPAADIEKIALLNSTYRYELPRYDQTLTPIGESGIEFVVRKRSGRELAAGGLVRETAQPSPADRRHFNQYKADHARMKADAGQTPPFEDETDL